MSTNRLALMALRGGPCGAVKSAQFATRIGMTNRYKMDYACEDEYYEREMTLLDAKLTKLPLPLDFRHKSPPVDDMMPHHINDVRFNFVPENMDRRMFLHDNAAILYDQNNDFYHGVGYIDEDMDYELPDPYHNMHMKHKRSPVMMFWFGFVSCGVILGYPTLGLKMPQKDNPIQYRKKYGTTGTIQQMQQLAHIEYGG